jgi:two-component system, OmpR family, heavy metal sensor histidine kinase CusS
VSNVNAYSMRRRLSIQLMVIAFVALGTISLAVYGACAALFDRSHSRLLTLKINKLTETSQSFGSSRLDAFRALLVNNASKRPATRLELRLENGESFYADDATDETHVLGEHVRSRDFALNVGANQPVLRGSFAIDVSTDVEILRSIAWVLLTATLLGSLIGAASAQWVVRQGLGPLRALTHQTERIARSKLKGRLALRRPVAELAPWIDEFNGLMDTVERTHEQLEAFNADVAHELRTPLSALIGKTEVALSRERSAAELSETLQANLEELHRLASLVNDMLFLSMADRGELAKREEPVALEECAAQVAEFYDALAQERSLRIEISGTAVARVDESLVKRGLSNLVANAVRYAEAASTITISIKEHEREVWLRVSNAGPAISEDHLPRLFERFYRADPARSDRISHHGLGLAIIAAIARMHRGTTDARSADSFTSIGFSVQRNPSA